MVRVGISPNILLMDFRSGDGEAESWVERRVVRRKKGTTGWMTPNMSQVRGGGADNANF